MFSSPSLGLSDDMGQDQALDGRAPLKLISGWSQRSTAIFGSEEPSPR